MNLLQLVTYTFNQVVLAVTLATQTVSALITSGWYLVVRDAAVLTNDIHSLLEDPTCGQQAQCAKLDTVITDIATLAGDIAALGNPQQTGIAVTLPSTPPAGYGGLDATATQVAVWQFIPPGFSQTMGFFQENAGLFAVNLSTTALRVPLADQMRWMIEGPWVNSNGPDLPDRDIPNLDPDTIASTDANIADWINRVQPGYGATLTPEGWATIAGSNGFDYYYDLSPWEFNLIRKNNPPATFGALGPPVWPGIADATLGTPVPFSGSSLSVPGPMDGVIVAITSVNQPLPHYAYGTANAWGKLGGLTFVDDNGDAEEYQLFGFVNAIYCPRFMIQASSCEIRNTSGIVGTVTPWTKS